MSTVTIVSDPSLDASTAMYAPQKSGLYAGEDLLPLGPCYIKSADGKVYKATGTAVNEAAEFAGICSRPAKAGEPVTLYGFGTRFRYGSGLTAGDVYYVSATAGAYDTAPTVGDQIGTIQAISATDVVVVRTAVVGVVGNSEIPDGSITAAKLTSGAGVAALLTAGLGNSVAYTKASTGALTLLASNPSKDRAVLILAQVTEAFADGNTSQSTFKVGQTGTTNKFWDTSVFTGATLGEVFAIGGVLSATDALLVTAVPAAGTGTGALAITVLAIPTT